jgi:hypothetical protein
MAESAPTSHCEPGRIRASRSSQGAFRAVPHGDVVAGAVIGLGSAWLTRNAPRRAFRLRAS